MSSLIDRIRDMEPERLRLIGAVLATAIVIAAVLVFGSSDDDTGETSSTVAEETAATQPSETTTPDSETGNGKGGDGEKGEGNSGSGDAEEEPADEEEPEGPPPPGSEEGDPVGEVPPDASPEENETAVILVIRTYLTSINSGIGYQACAQLSPDGIVAMERKLAEVAPETEGSQCRQSILLYSSAYGNTIRDPKITNLKVSGTTASAMGPLREPARLRRYDNVWLIDEYGQ